MRIAVIGLGLIGGSIALAARERLNADVVGWDVDEAAAQAALARGAISSRVGPLADAVTGADAVFVAAPVGALPDLIGAVLRAAPATCVVSDVGSTKRLIVAAHSDSRFIGGHPLAGAETSGIANARADLFDGETWYLTTSQSADPALYGRLSEIVSAFGSTPVAIDPEAHDRLLALISHLPHVFANVLVTMAAQATDPQPLPAVGPSFRDATRVAGANTKIWTDIYMSNRDALTASLDDAIARLARVREALADADEAELARWNEAAARDRRIVASTGHPHLERS